MGSFYDPDEGDFRPHHLLGSLTDSLHRDFLEYWEQHAESEASEEDQKRFKSYLDFASALRPALHSLSVTQGLTDAGSSLASANGSDYVGDAGSTVVLTHFLGSHPIIHYGIQIMLAQEAVDELLTEAESRFENLLSLVAFRRLSERAGAYLDRATRLYLWNFEPETVVMCAAVLEAAYETRFNDLDMFRLQITKNGQTFEPHQYEHAAELLKVYSKGERAAARDLRRARNDVLHAIPAVRLSAVTAIEQTATLLDRLFPK